MDERSFGSWLLSIAGFVCQEWVRRKRTGERHLERLAPAPAAGPERESDLPLAEAVAALPDDLQQILALRHGEGMSCEEIARALDRPLGTVTKMLSRAHADLRERLEKR